VLYFVSTTVNPILYNVLSRKYRQAFTMTLCNACMDDATRQRLQRDGFGAFSVYYSAARASANTVPAMDIGDPLASRRRRTWGNVATAAAAVVVVERPTGNLLSPVESGTGTVTTSSVVSRSPRGSTSALPSVRYHNGSVIVDADTEPRHIRFMASDAKV